MRLVFLVDTIRPGTGGTASVLELAQTAAEQGHRVSVVIARFDPAFSASRAALLRASRGALSVHFAPGLMYRWSSFDGWARIWATAAPQGLRVGGRRLARVLAERLGAVLANGLARVAEQVLAEADVVIKALSLTGAQLSGLRRVTRGVIVQNHAGSVSAYRDFWLNETHRPLGAPRSQSLYVAFCGGFDQVLFQSPTQANQCAALDPSLSARVQVLLPTCDETSVERAMQAESPYAREEEAVTVVGTLQPRKGQVRVLEAFAFVARERPSATLHLVGSDQVDRQYAEAIALKARALGLDGRVRIHGHRGDYLRFLVHAHLLVLSSFAEGVPRVVREAMCARVPVVGFELEGLEDFLRAPDEVGVVPQESAPGVLAQAIVDRLADPEGAAAQAARAQRRYQDQLSQDRYRHDVRTWLESLQIRIAARERSQ